jgi:hypothetical protein
VLLVKLVKSYFEFLSGLVFGAIVATIVTCAIYEIAVGHLSSAEFLKIRDCLEANYNEE